MTDDTAATFSSLGAPASAATALAARGYATPTPVQACVLQAGDRDLLVSSQTGSGKTVAFGLVMARRLLGEDGTLSHGERPRALVVAPTRELAQQVKRELCWLFATTGARIAACTGGTDLRGDSRALRLGVDIVVGTPGRLVDLVARRSLDLAGVEVLVLDEADEMLDLGFREALESLLGATPEARRTLLFSATLPTPIVQLARRYQKDALSIDPRGARGAGTRAAPHEDIRHVAHLCESGERVRALVNVLRLGDEERVIVFCRTRENVSEVHADLTARGFAATAISGDRAQDERTRALEALRSGRVRVLVATNVAARGLDLPDVGLVVHVDLPENAEALTHRSGRTGRAGNKGVNLFVVERGARRKAERLFAEASLQLQWTTAPDAEAVAAHDRARLVAAIESALAPSDPAPADASPASPRDPAVSALARQLVAEHDPAALVSLLLERALAARPPGEKLTHVELREAAPPRRPAPSGDMALFTINLGSKDNAEANWILPLVCRRGGITKRDIGAIRVARDRTFIEVSTRVAREFAANSAERDPRAPNVRITPATEPLPLRAAPSIRPHKAPAHKAPAHKAPAHETSMHGAPAHKTPAHDTSMHKAPAHKTPAHEAHEYKAGDRSPSRSNPPTSAPTKSEHRAPPRGTKPPTRKTPPRY